MPRKFEKMTRKGKQALVSEEIEPRICHLEYGVVRILCTSYVQ